MTLSHEPHKEQGLKQKDLRKPTPALLIDIRNSKIPPPKKLALLQLVETRTTELTDRDRAYVLLKFSFCYEDFGDMATALEYAEKIQNDPALFAVSDKEKIIRRTTWLKTQQAKPAQKAQPASQPQPTLPPRPIRPISASQAFQNSDHAGNNPTAQIEILSPILTAENWENLRRLDEDLVVDYIFRLCEAYQRNNSLQKAQTLMYWAWEKYPRCSRKKEIRAKISELETLTGQEITKED